MHTHTLGRGQVYPHSGVLATKRMNINMDILSTNDMDESQNNYDE